MYLVSVLRTQLVVVTRDCNVRALDIKCVPRAYLERDIVMTVSHYIKLMLVLPTDAPRL